MIETKKGRSRSVATPGEGYDLLRVKAASLNSEELASAYVMMEDWGRELRKGSKGKNNRKVKDEVAQYEALVNDLYYETTPVSPETFLLNEHFLGKVGKQLYPKLVDDFVELFEGDYNKVMILGSLGSGKSTFSQLGMCRILYELSCLRDPALCLGLQSESRLDLVAISIKLGIAQRVLLEPVAALTRQSPYFMERFKAEETNNELRFPKHVNMQIATNETNSAVSLNVIGGVIDEVNFMDSPHNKAVSAGRVDSLSTAEGLYSSLHYRVKSRFQSTNRSLGMLFIVSSKRLKTDFTEKQIQMDMDDPKVFVRDHNLWEVKPGQYMNSKWFNVLVGSDLIRSRILNKNEAMSKPEEENGCYIIEVPEEFRKDFEFNPDRSLRDLAGIPTEAINPFISRRDLIMDAVNPNRKHPFAPYEWTAGTHYVFDWSLLSKKDNRSGEIRPILNPDAPRHVHIDTSLSGDSTGIAMGHIGGWKKVTKKDDDGKEVSEELPIIVIDFVLRVNPPKGEEIQLGDIRQLIYMLTQEGGFSIPMITTDGYQATDTRQHFVRKGYKSELVSVDRTPGPYLSMKYAIYEQRLDIYEYEPFLEEAKSLEWSVTKHKVDHPMNGRKDVCDAIAAVCFTLQGLDTNKGIQFNTPGPQYGIIEHADDETGDDGTWVLPGTARPVVDQRTVDQQKFEGARNRGGRRNEVNGGTETDDPKIDQWWKAKN